MELPESLAVSVTADDITNATPHAWGRDPVSLAMVRALDLEPRQVNADTYVIDVIRQGTGAVVGHYATPANVRTFLQLFNGRSDERARLRPFTFVAYRFPVSAYKVIGGYDGQAAPCDLKGNVTPITEDNV